MTQAIHKAMLQAMREIAAIGIAKDKTATLGGANVKYRGIEAAMNAMSGILIRCGISVTADYTDLHVQERVKGDPADGKATRFVTLRGAFTFVSVEDSSSVTFACFGEAMDSGDKATTKAQSVAFRTALFQAFVVPFMAIDPEEGGDESGDENAPAEYAYGGELRELVRERAKLMRATKTDADALQFWKDNREQFADFKPAYDAFKLACQQHREGLSANGGAQ